MSVDSLDANAAITAAVLAITNMTTSILIPTANPVKNECVLQANIISI